MSRAKCEVTLTNRLPVPDVILVQIAPAFCACTCPEIPCLNLFGDPNFPIDVDIEAISIFSILACIRSRPLSVLSKACCASYGHFPGCRCRNSNAKGLFRFLSPLLQMRVPRGDRIMKHARSRTLNTHPWHTLRSALMVAVFYEQGRIFRRRMEIADRRDLAGDFAEPRRFRPQIT